jgi:hypothetical protein
MGSGAGRGRTAHQASGVQRVHRREHRGARGVPRGGEGQDLELVHGGSRSDSAADGVGKAFHVARQKSFTTFHVMENSAWRSGAAAQHMHQDRDDNRRHVGDEARSTAGRAARDDDAPSRQAGIDRRRHGAMTMGTRPDGGLPNARVR